MNEKLWGGRFSANTDEIVDDFNSSIRFDKRLYKYDILGSIAHVKMLAKQAIIETDDAKKIEAALELILNEIEEGKIEFSIAAEDIHMNIETILIEKIGEVGKKLHTARSRNDQVALDLRMYLKNEIKNIQGLIEKLLKTLLNLAKNHKGTIMAGCTHLQKAQPITLCHHLMAYFEMFKRDYGRLEDTYRRTNVMPLGSCALAGTTYPLDREFVASELGFEGITLNSLDGVSDRDFCVELEGAISIIMVHLSRFCEEIILWATPEFNYIELDDAFSTGSSIMPQKKNPDIAELIRGKCGRVFGNLIGTLTMLKGLPLAYNKDMQEDKEAIFNSVDTIKTCLEIFEKMLASSKFNQEKMLTGAKLGYTNATDVADYLVKKGVPFRNTHKISGEIVFYCIKKGAALDEITLDEYKKFSPLFEEDIFNAISLKNCVEGRKIIGSPSKSAMELVININERYLNELKR